jgi:hypothetical protein
MGWNGPRDDYDARKIVNLLVFSSLSTFQKVQPQDSKCLILLRPLYLKKILSLKLYNCFFCLDYLKNKLHYLLKIRFILNVDIQEKKPDLPKEVLAQHI